MLAEIVCDHVIKSINKSFNKYKKKPSFIYRPGRSSSPPLQDKTLSVPVHDLLTTYRCNNATALKLSIAIISAAAKVSPGETHHPSHSFNTHVITCNWKGCTMHQQHTTASGYNWMPPTRRSDIVVADKISGSDWGCRSASAPSIAARIEIICGGVQKILATSIHNTDFAQRCISNYLLLVNNHVLPALRRFIETTHPYLRLSLRDDTTEYFVNRPPTPSFLTTDSRALFRRFNDHYHRYC